MPHAFANSMAQTRRREKRALKKSLGNTRTLARMSKQNAELAEHGRNFFENAFNKEVNKRQAAEAELKKQELMLRSKPSHS